MSKLAATALLWGLSVLLLSVACGGGQEDGRVPIHRIDFTDVELSAVEYFDPPFTGQYPEVVAEVNGEPITGEALAARQVMLEMERRQLTGEFADAYPEWYVSLQLAEIESADPLEAVIEQELGRQAAERLGLLPPYEEAAQFVRKQEEWFVKTLAEASPTEHEELLELYRADGRPEEDWASDEELVERTRQRLSVDALRERFCAPPATPDDPLTLSTRRDCSEFLEAEREKAGIVYFVRWAD